MAAEQLIENIGVYANGCVGEQFCSAPNQDISDRFVSLSPKETHVALIGDWLREYVSVALGRVRDCYVSRVLESGEIELLEKPTVTISDEKMQGESMQENL